MSESDKTILAVYKSLDDENSGARGNEMQTAGSRKHSLRQQQEAGAWPHTLRPQALPDAACR